MEEKILELVKDYFDWQLSECKEALEHQRESTSKAMKEVNFKKCFMDYGMGVVDFATISLGVDYHSVKDLYKNYRDEIEKL